MIGTEVIGYGLLGIALGVVTGVPIGLVNLAVIHGAATHGLRRGIGIAAGGASADAVHAWLGFAGVGLLLGSHPVVSPILFAASGLFIIGYVAVVVRYREEGNERAAVGQPVGGPRGAFRTGYLAGIGLTLPNPSALAAWVVVGAIFGPVGYLEATAVAMGVGAGSLVWFSLLAHLGRRGRNLLAVRRRWVTYALALVMLGFGVYALVRAVMAIV